MRRKVLPGASFKTPEGARSCSLYGEGGREKFVLYEVHSVRGPPKAQREMSSETQLASKKGRPTYSEDPSPPMPAQQTMGKKKPMGLPHGRGEAGPQGWGSHNSYPLKGKMTLERINFRGGGGSRLQSIDSEYSFNSSPHLKLSWEGPKKATEISVPYLLFHYPITLFQDEEGSWTLVRSFHLKRRKNVDGWGVLTTVHRPSRG